MTDFGTPNRKRHDGRFVARGLRVRAPVRFSLADFEIRRPRFRAVSRKQRPAVTGLNRLEFSIFSMHFFDLSSPTTQSMILCVFALLKSKKSMLNIENSRRLSPVTTGVTQVLV